MPGLCTSPGGAGRISMLASLPETNKLVKTHFLRGGTLNRICAFDGVVENIRHGVIVTFWGKFDNCAI